MFFIFHFYICVAPIWLPACQLRGEEVDPEEFATEEKCHATLVIDQLPEA